jgi:O-acetylserine/cysteine efflux transporter|tara:strand:- start:89 stop:946 length:858 start_codon:yes stop_codon:yes gene_type:complete
LSTKHTLLILFVVFLLGSAYPTGKLGLNDSIPPILFGALRMAVVFICLVPFFKFDIPEKKYVIPLIGFSICFGVGANLFLYLSINASSILAPITIGAQLSIPFGIILSSIFLNEKISYKKWLLIMTSFFGIVILAFDPKVLEEIIGSLLICAMAFFYGLSQVFSRYLKDLDVKYTNTIMSFTGFVILILLSSMFEGNTFQTIKNISLESWLTVLYAGAIISLLGHLMMFYLYKFYPLDMVLPFYALFPVFGLILTFFIFGEIPSFITILGGIIVITSVFFAQKMR